MNLRLIPPALVVPSIILLSCGCTSPTKTAESKQQPAAAQAEEPYVPVNSLGSWIPRKVKTKSDLLGDSTKTVAPEAMNAVTARGASGVEKDSKE